MALRSEELMIGDWVLFEGEPCRIIALDDEYICQSLTNTYYTLDCFEPITLTPEILEKNGFSKTGAYIFEDDYEHQILIYLKDENNTGGAYTYIDAHCGCLDISEMPVSHVHELQHALRLCGIENEIKL